MCRLVDIDGGCFILRLGDFATFATVSDDALRGTSVPESFATRAVFSRRVSAWGECVQAGWSKRGEWRPLEGRVSYSNAVGSAANALRKSVRSDCGSMAKRLFDILVSLIAIVLFSPAMLVIAVLVRWKMGSPILFRQDRPGLNGNLFTMLKFRTMTDDRDENGNLLPDTVRLKPFGVLLRRTSLDELPQLINVLKGEMSIVGPRPLVKEYLDRYTTEQMRRHLVRPGITGLAQISGRNFLPWEERFILDVHYADNHTFWLDMRIIWQTMWLVARQDGVSADATLVQTEFVGKKSQESRKTPSEPVEAKSSEPSSGS